MNLGRGWEGEEGRASFWHCGAILNAGFMLLHQKCTRLNLGVLCKMRTEKVFCLMELLWQTWGRLKPQKQSWKNEDRGSARPEKLESELVYV